MKTKIVGIFIFILLTFNVVFSVLGAFNEVNDIVFIDIKQYDFEIKNTLYGDEYNTGYILYSPMQSNNTYLIDFNKDVKHLWESNYDPRLSAYLLENGELLRMVSFKINLRFIAGGYGGGIQKLDWNGTILWEFEYSTDKYCLHHDAEPLPNGNILMIAWEYKTLQEAIDAGLDPNRVASNSLWPDHIIEVKPNGINGGDIVWEWHVWDHLIQDYDQTKENFGTVADHPELIDINYGATYQDWNHINSIDYHEEFDQILLSVHSFNEIWVIDHNTTTEEAADHMGGRYGKGGDLLYRWGNPHAYRAGSLSDQKYFLQHGATWVKSGYPGEGNILVFNNGNLNRPYSSVDEIVPPVDSYGNYIYNNGTAYGPDEQIWIYTSENPADLFSLLLSNAQRLPNGNTLICRGQGGLFLEVTPDKNVVWEYNIPFYEGGAFMLSWYPENYSGLRNLFGNNPPSKPDPPNGQIRCNIGISYNYSISAIDPEDDKVFYYIDWQDGKNSGWMGPYASGKEIISNHTWNESGKYEIKVKAKDILGAESEWSDPLIVSMPKNKAVNKLFNRIIENHPHLFSILRQILRQ